MKNLIEGLKLAIKHKACKGNREAFEKALDKCNELECYQIALGSRNWLLEHDIIKKSDLPVIEILSNGIGIRYHDNGKLMSRVNIKNCSFDGLYEEWYENGQLCVRSNYKNDERHGLREEWYDNGQLYLHECYKNGEIVS